jgi:mycothiol synthase
LEGGGYQHDIAKLEIEPMPLPFQHDDLWFVALAGERVVGAVCCRASTPRSKDAAHVNILGVRPRWRGRGIGRALLLAAFGELRRRGIPAVDLGVDSENQTGAPRPYEQVGMRAERCAEWWEKEL